MRRDLEALKRLASLNLDDLWIGVVASSGKIQELIIDLNTEGQLFERGIDSEGQSLGVYSQFTKAIKQREGLPFDRVTLFDSGDFYKSFKVSTSGNEVLIIADTEKEDKDLSEVYGEAIIGLTDESLEILSEFILPIIREKIIEYVLNGTSLR